LPFKVTPNKVIHGSCSSIRSVSPFLKY
jgi:hypothetical protein